MLDEHGCEFSAGHKSTTHIRARCNAVVDDERYSVRASGRGGASGIVSRCISRSYDTGNRNRRERK
jgi:hypothetical protein